ncbi:insulinase family protein [bacterium]|nr:insulinase family protein [bacterium]
MTNPHGFKLFLETDLVEIKSRGYLYGHERSGARLVYIQNSDDNKVFVITLRTPAFDDTGLAHILEHSVLGGSRKYPLRDAFSEALTGSLQTYLNAITYPDKTMYPLASRNMTDFYNLVDYYCDAVFFPRIYEDPFIFLQEGWRYHYPSKRGPIRYNGVVYNENLSFQAIPEHILWSESVQAIFPDTHYRFDAGGRAERIIDLTRTAFLDYHRNYYHPSNAYFFVWGDLAIDELLERLDRDYLGQFQKKSEISSLEVQNSFSELVIKRNVYALDDRKRAGRQTLMGLNFVTGFTVDPEQRLAQGTLENMFFTSEASPLKKVLYERDICHDLWGGYDPNYLQSVFCFFGSQLRQNWHLKFRRTILETLTELVKNGIDRAQLEAALHTTEFELRESDPGHDPQGLFYADLCYQSWLYGGNPFGHLAFEPCLTALWRKKDSDYFERLIRRLFLENTHTALVVLTPQPGLVEQERRKTCRSLAQYKRRLSEHAKNELLEQTKTLLERQTTPDPPEIIQDLFHLPMTSIKPSPDLQIPQIAFAADNRLFIHRNDQNEVVYFHCYFKADGLTFEELCYLPILAELLTDVRTEQHTFSSLATQLQIYTGGISVRPIVLPLEHDHSGSQIYLLVLARTLPHNINPMFELLGEVLLTSKYDDAIRIRHLIRSILAELETAIRTGYEVVPLRLISYFSDRGAIKESLNGLSLYYFLRELESQFERKFDELRLTLERLQRKLFTRNRLTASISCQEPEFAGFQQAYSLFAEQLPVDQAKPAPLIITRPLANEGLMFESLINFVARGYNFRQLGYEYHGVMQVIKNYLSLDYLYYAIRSKGGAYNVSFMLDRFGTMLALSISDPRIVKTLKTFGSIGPVIRGLSLTQSRLNRFIIGTIASLDLPMTVLQRTEYENEHILCGVSMEQRQLEREQVLSATVPVIRAHAELIDAVMKQNAFCVLGNKKQIISHRQIFSTIQNVFGKTARR